MEAVARELPTKAREEIERHEQWYVEYCALLGSKRKAIEAWRTHKEVGGLDTEGRGGEGRGANSAHGQWSLGACLCLGFIYTCTYMKQCKIRYLIVRIRRSLSLSKKLDST